MSVQIDSNDARREVTLIKRGHTWRFACAPGEEPALLDEAARLAEADDGFDWFDAAVLAHALGSCIGSELQGLVADRTGAAHFMSSSPQPDAATRIGNHS
ncbi:MAG: hypothetical protein ACF8QF_03095 [Phycisphaerales bacterium]